MSEERVTTRARRARVLVVGAGGASGVNGQASTVFGATAAGGGTSVGWYSDGEGIAGGSGGGANANESTNRGGASTGNSLGANSGTIYGNRGGHMTTARSGSTRAAGGGGAGGAALDFATHRVFVLGDCHHLCGAGALRAAYPAFRA